VLKLSLVYELNGHVSYRCQCNIIVASKKYEEVNVFLKFMILMDAFDSTVEYTKGGSKEEGSPCRGECPSAISPIQLYGNALTLVVSNFIECALLCLFFFCPYD